MIYTMFSMYSTYGIYSIWQESHDGPSDRDDMQTTYERTLKAHEGMGAGNGACAEHTTARSMRHCYAY